MTGVQTCALPIYESVSNLMSIDQDDFTFAINQFRETFAAVRNTVKKIRQRLQDSNCSFAKADETVLVSEYATRNIKKFRIDGEPAEMSASVVSIGVDCFVKDLFVKRSKKRKSHGSS